MVYVSVSIMLTFKASLRDIVRIRVSFSRRVTFMKRVKICVRLGLV
jgi:hypothetical protein